MVDPAGRACPVPAFLGIGVLKAGTTWLHHQLTEHPGIWLPPEKEIHYFNFPDVNIWKILTGRRPIEIFWKQRLKAEITWGNFRNNRPRFGWYRRFFFGRRNDDWYRQLFFPGPGQIAGEISATYCNLSPEGFAHLARFQPGVKLILLLRSPVDQIWSHLKMRFPEECRVMDPAGARAKLAQYPFILRTTDYATILRNIRENYPSDLLLVGYYDEIKTNPQSLLNRITEFLEVPLLVLPENQLRRRVNRGTEISCPKPVKQELARQVLPFLEKFARDSRQPYPGKWLVETEKLLSED